MKRTPLPPRSKPIPRSGKPRSRRPGVRRSSRVLDPQRLAWIRRLPCWACYRQSYDADLMTCSRWHRVRSEAAHIGLSTDRRGLSQKHGDDTAIPLCPDCHQHGKEAIHKGNPEAFFAARGADRDTVVRLFQRLWEANREAWEKRDQR